jgi:hypothetical protein
MVSRRLLSSGASHVISVTLLAREKRSKQLNSKALVVVLIMELIARNLRRSPPPSATLEREEYAKRDKDMLWYLLRGSIWETWTRWVGFRFSAYRRSYDHVLDRNSKGSCPAPFTNHSLACLVRWWEIGSLSSTSIIIVRSSVLLKREKALTFSIDTAL